MPEPPLKILEKIDPDILSRIEGATKFVFADGALPRKVKLLIAVALDASKGAAQGVASLARQALEAGATKQELAEALRVAHYITGVGSTYTAAQGLREVL